jgi:hypothetical protein
LGAGLVLFGIQRHVAAIAATARGQGGEPARELATHLRRLVACLLAGGAFVCMALALLAYAVLERIDHELAVLG